MAKRDDKSALTKAIEAIRNPAPGVTLVSHGWVKSSCDWARHDNGIDYTDCGKTFCFDDAGKPGEHGFKWCPYCRKPITVAESAHVG